MQSHLIMADGVSHDVGQQWIPIECFRCGICCIRYRPRVTAREVERIARASGMSVQSFTSKFVRATGTKRGQILQGDEDRCPFLSQDEVTGRATCSIYAVRPRACRRWIASLSRPECREGLSRLKASSAIMLPDELYASPDRVEKLCSALNSQPRESNPRTSPGRPVLRGSCAPSSKPPT